jgi:UDP-3-O-[3-hydroxymyristoyl] N-acetylglucosamine deacetylase
LEGFKISDLNQKTIERPAQIRGIGIHTGKGSIISILPAPCDTGIKFKIGSEYIDADVNNVQNTSRCTSIGRKEQSIHTVEHLLAACYCLGLDNLIIEIQGEEVPILDGSSLEFINVLKESGIVSLEKEKKILTIEDKVSYRKDESFVVALPADKLSITTVVDYPNPLIGMQVIVFCPEDENFEEIIAPARTFAFKQEVEQLRKAGLGLGGSLDNVVIIDKENYLNELRFQDEIVRHKCLDLIGDLSLVGAKIKGHIFAYKPGHRTNVEFVKSLLSSSKGWQKLQIS